MRLTVVGCSGSYPGPGDACSGYLVQGGGVNVIIDMGPGTLANLQQHIGVRMSEQSAFVGNSDPTDDERPAFDQLVNVVALSDSEVHR